MSGQGRARRVSARMRSQMDQWRALVAEGVTAAEMWANGIARLEDWLNRKDGAPMEEPNSGSVESAEGERHYFADRRRGLAVWAHVIDAAHDEEGRAGLDAIAAEASEQGRTTALLAEVCAAALRVCPTLADSLDGAAEELLEAAHGEVEEQCANAEGWDIDPDSGNDAAWMSDDD